MRRSFFVAAGALLALAACEPKPAPEAAPEAAAPAEPAPPARAVEITSPAEGDTVQGPSVTVHMAAHGFPIQPAADTMQMGGGHLHVFLDRDVSAAGQPIPAEDNFIIHKGDGADSIVIAKVAPGAHRLIAVVGDSKHVPLTPSLEDTVNFVVK